MTYEFMSPSFISKAMVAMERWLPAASPTAACSGGKDETDVDRRIAEKEREKKGENRERQGRIGSRISRRKHPITPLQKDLRHTQIEVKLDVGN
ncbi:hypothetical protein AAHA92_25013 [Salvia divinorum]|uniref:Uncharacterized protein n=1 Tax=Salvia divinorum TaxID=28513 RepID=A0ABD1GCD4_SALDI